jgi:hypothetical protein
MSNLRYIVAYPHPENGVTCNKTIYYYECEAKRAAEFIGGWVIPVDLKINQPISGTIPI